MHNNQCLKNGYNINHLRQCILDVFLICLLIIDKKKPNLKISLSFKTRYTQTILSYMCCPLFYFTTNLIVTLWEKSSHISTYPFLTFQPLWSVEGK